MALASGQSWATPLTGIQSDLLHGLLEGQAILTLFNRIGLSANQLNSQLHKLTRSVHVHGHIEGRLPSQGREKHQFALHALFLHPCLFLANDLGHRLRCDGLNVGVIRKLRIGHDRGRIGVDQDHSETLRAAPCSLSPRIIKFTCLANDDRASTDDEH